MGFTGEDKLNYELITAVLYAHWARAVASALGVC